jgi:hypothetical protein
MNELQSQFAVLFIIMGGFLLIGTMAVVLKYVHNEFVAEYKTNRVLQNMILRQHLLNMFIAEFKNSTMEALTTEQKRKEDEIRINFAEQLQTALDNWEKK